MDKRFLELWGNTLLLMAKQQELAESVSRWMARGTAEAADIDKLSTLPAAEAFLRYWQQSTQEAQASFRRFADTFGLVPKAEVLELEKKCAALEEKIAALEAQPQPRGGDPAMAASISNDWAAGFQRLVKQQTEQFQELLKIAAPFLKPTDED